LSRTDLSLIFNHLQFFNNAQFLDFIDEPTLFSIEAERARINEFLARVHPNWRFKPWKKC
jgi:hypothetical protein